MSRKAKILIGIILTIFGLAITASFSQSTDLGNELLEWNELEKLQHDTKLDNTTIHQVLAERINHLQTFSSRCPATAKVDGEYMLRPALSTIPPFRVYCEYGTYGGDEGAIVIHRRFSGKLSFDRTWSDYRKGFGSLQSEFWLGLEKIHQITRGGHFELTVVLKDDNGEERSAQYSGFSVGSEFDRYKLNIGYFVSGTAGDALQPHNAKYFQTIDEKIENSNCAKTYKSGWWYDKCYYSNLNVPYENGKILPNTLWRSLTNTSFIKESRMIIKLMF